MNNNLKTINSSQAPAAIGPYSQAVIAGNFVFCSGQLGIDPQTNQLVDGIGPQTKQVLTNLTKVLQAAGSSLTKVVKTTIYLKDLNDFAVVNQIYAQFFPNHKPSRATIQVAALPKNALIEIEAIALI